MRVAAVLLAALVVAAPAWAHAEVSPASIQAKRTTALTLEVPTEGETAATVRVVVGAPRGLEAGSVSWAGRTRGVVRLTFTARADAPGDYVLRVRQTYSDGTVATWSPVVHVQVPRNDNRDRLVILLIAAAVVTAGFVLRRVRQRP